MAADHLALTKAGNNVIFYLDGVGYAAPPYTSTFIFNSNLGIGARGDNFAASFFGALDEIDFYNRALTTTEVQASHFSTTLGKCPLPLIWVLQPTNQTVFLGGSATFSAAVAGGSPAWQWFLNGAGLQGETNSSLIISNTTWFHAGSYSVNASNAAGAISSSNALLTLFTPQLLTNGSFENRDLSPWVLTDIANPTTPLAVRGAGYNSGFGFFSATPTDGTSCLVNGFDGQGPGRIRAAVDVVLPAGPITLTFDYRLGWDMANYGGSSRPRLFVVTIEPSGGGVGLATNLIFTAPFGTENYDTGPLSGSVDLSPFSGRSIRVSFDAVIPEAFTGPGFMQLDHVQLISTPVPQLLVSKAGATASATLAWPVRFTNLVVQQTTNLSPPITWITLPTNTISHGPTNNGFTIPTTLPRAFYRLTSP